MMKNVFFILSALFFLKESILLLTQRSYQWKSGGLYFFLFQLGFLIYFFAPFLHLEFHFESIGLAFSGGALIALCVNVLKMPKGNPLMKGLWRFPLFTGLVGWYLKDYPPFLLWFLLVLISSWILKKERKNFELSLSIINSVKYLAFLSAITTYWSSGFAMFFFFLSLWKSYQLLEGFKVKLILINKADLK